MLRSLVGSEMCIRDRLHTEQLGTVKVGEKGTNVRSYTRCCNTLLFTAGGKSFPGAFRPMNRNCIRNNDSDDSPFVPVGDVPNVQAASAFVPEEVPEPRHSSLPCGLLCGFIGGICRAKCCCDRSGVLADDPAIQSDPESADVEVVPITWE
eukprot:TRINITY_DN24073_c0_g1_i3.p2 TRINITY_DN24073_c0_g1~~TRINITY_DN24073_c0_g1_i3.p2  ORF type:complete len:151 (+),score=29.97 TRINITY_DN24073_c0_g1_i3:170-622(+)